MSLALVGNRKGIRLHKLCTNYPSLNPPLLFFHCHPFCCLRKTWLDVVKEDVKGNLLISVRLENWLLN